MSIANKLKKAITGGEWFVAYRSGKGNYLLANAPPNQWCADPFVYEADGEHYIFVEQYVNEKEKGCIGFFHFENGVPVNKGILIENSYHMSYPDVFEYDGKYFMIPESSANSTVDLYIADQFPDKWRKVNSLITGSKYVDSTVYRARDQFYLISYTMIDGYEVHVFALDMDEQKVELIAKKRYEKNVARPGGRLFLEEGKLMRPAQDCSRKYGEALIIYQIDDINKNGEFIEHEVRRVESGMLHVENNPERVHQLTNDGLYEVVDVYKERLDLLHVPRIILRSRRR